MWLRKFIRIMRYWRGNCRSRVRERVAFRRHESQIPMPESTAEYSVTNAVSCG